MANGRVTDDSPKPKAIQISTAPVLMGNNCMGVFLYVLYDDGSLWEYDPQPPGNFTRIVLPV